MNSIQLSPRSAVQHDSKVCSEMTPQVVEKVKKIAMDILIAAIDCPYLLRTLEDSNVWEGSLASCGENVRNWFRIYKEANSNLPSTHPDQLNDEIIALTEQLEGMEAHINSLSLNVHFVPKVPIGQQENSLSKMGAALIENREKLYERILQLKKQMKEASSLKMENEPKLHWAMESFTNSLLKSFSADHEAEAFMAKVRLPLDLSKNWRSW